MVVYRINLNLFFDSLKDVQDFKIAFQAYIAKTRNVGTGLNLEKSNAVLHICHHDENPPAPCKEILYQWEHT